MIESNDVNLFAACILATCYITLSLAANKFKIWTVIQVPLEALKASSWAAQACDLGVTDTTSLLMKGL
jgi:hypothetical protein